MHIAIVHGYMLEGTGSNLYVQNMCREFCRLGHQVSLLSQADNRDEFDFIARAVDFAPDNQQSEVLFQRKTGYPGQCTAYRPSLGDLLPVYVFDHYQGYRVKEFTELSVSEIEDYIERNKTAMETCFGRSGPDLFLTNHLIMQPVYTARFCQQMGKVQHFLTVHGSCLNFSVRKSPLLTEYARSAFPWADRIIFVSHYARQEFLDYFEHNSVLAQKTVAIPAGVNLDKFKPLNFNERKADRINLLLHSLENTENAKGRTGEEKLKFRQAVVNVNESEELQQLVKLDNNADKWAVDTDTAERLAAVDWQQSPVILYYGKFLWTKGVQLLLAAAPLVLNKEPDTHFFLVGFGSYRSYLEALVAVLDSGRRDLFYELITRPQDYNSAVDPASAQYFAGLLEKLSDQDFAENYYGAARDRLAQRVIFTGYIGHDGLKDLIPCSDISVATSIFPESFGMVSVEALASGVIPLLADHSGFSEVNRDCSVEFRDIFDNLRLNPLILNEQLVLNLANNLLVLLEYFKQITLQERQQIRTRAHHLAYSKYSWSSVASGYLQLSKESI